MHAHMKAYTHSTRTQQICNVRDNPPAALDGALPPPPPAWLRAGNTGRGDESSFKEQGVARGRGSPRSKYSFFGKVFPAQHSASPHESGSCGRVRDTPAGEGECERKGAGRGEGIRANPNEWPEARSTRVLLKVPEMCRATPMTLEPCNKTLHNPKPRRRPNSPASKDVPPATPRACTRTQNAS